MEAGGPREADWVEPPGGGGLCQEAVGACTGNWFRTARQAQMRRDRRARENKALWHDMLAKQTNPAANADDFQLLFLRPSVNVWLKKTKGFYFPYHLTYSLEKENIYITSEVLNRGLSIFFQVPTQYFPLTIRHLLLEVPQCPRLRNLSTEPLQASILTTESISPALHQGPRPKPQPSPTQHTALASRLSCPQNAS